MMQQRKDEIQAKKAKLAELKRQRELRQQEFAAGRQSLSTQVEATSPKNRTEDRQNLDSLISSLVGENSVTPNAQSRRLAAASSANVERYPNYTVDSRDAGAEGHALPSVAPVLHARIGAPQKLGFAPLTTLYEIKGDPPKREIITYSKGVQTAQTWTPSRASSSSDTDAEEQVFGERRPMRSLSRRQREREARMRQDIRKEAVEEIKAQQKPDREEAQVPGEHKKPDLVVQSIPLEELEALTSSYEFLDFLERSSKVVERALDEDYNLLSDYRVDYLNADGEEDDGPGMRAQKGRRVKEVVQFYDERWSKKRMVTDLGFSPKFPELVLASYTKSSSASSDPDGLIQVWNLHMQNRPEYMFHATSDILTAKFSPFHPNLILGGCYSGQVLLWDTRSRSPSHVQQTTLTGAGHSHPIYSLDIVGTQNAHNIVTTSTDGVVCSWAIDMLSTPQHRLTLRSPVPTTPTTFTRTPFAYDIAPTCTAFAPTQTTYFLAGTEQGPIQLVHRHDRAGAPAGIDTHVSYRAHSAPVTGLDFHNASGPHNLGDLVLSTGLDWSVKLWRVRTPAATVVDRSIVDPGSDKYVVKPLLELHRDDAVYDVKWSPARPSVFACVDGGGYLEVWDLNADLEVPAARAQPAPRVVEASRGGVRGTEAGPYDMVAGIEGRGTGRSLNKCAWETGEGKRIAVGGLDGLVSVFEVGSELGGAENAKEEEWDGVKRLVSRLERGWR